MNDCEKSVQNFFSTNFGSVLCVLMFIRTRTDIYTSIHLCVCVYKLHNHQHKYIKCEWINIYISIFRLFKIAYLYCGVGHHLVPLSRVRRSLGQTFSRNRRVWRVTACV